MKRIHLYLCSLLLTLMAVSCNEEFDAPPMVVPQAKHKPNMTIAEFKEKYWQDAVNYIDTVKEEIVIHGRVISSDATGNIYKNLSIQDETGALTISVNQNNLYTDYRVGQEIVIPMKDLYIGKYNGQQQLGYPSYFAGGGVWNATFLPANIWKEKAEPNGMPAPAEIDTVRVKISELVHDAATLRKYQGQLVRLDGVKWAEADGTTTYANADATTSRNLTDMDGNTIVVRNSNYATFRNAPLPLGTGSVVGILGYYGTRNGQNGTWQLTIRSTADCIGFSSSTKGLKTDPYTVDEAVALRDSSKTGWVTGYIVGAVAPEVTEVKSNADIQWQAPTTLGTTLVIGATPETKDLKNAIVISLPQGSAFRTQANLKDNAALYKSQIWVYGTTGKYMGTAGLLNNSGSTNEFQLSMATGGVTTLSETFDTALPSGWKNLKAKGDKDWYYKSFQSNGYAAVTGYNGKQPPFDAWLISPAINITEAATKVLSFKTQVNGYGSTTSKFEVYLMSTDDPSTATLHKLNVKLATAPASGYSAWVETGDIDLSTYDGTYFIGFRYTAEQDAQYATWCLDDVKFNSSGTVVDPQPIETGTRADFESLTPTGTYGSHTTKVGWKATNANVLEGGEVDNNPTFKFIGFVTGSTTVYAKAVGLNGKTSAVGVVESPVLHNGLGTLSLNYGLPYTDTKIGFKVEILQNGNVVQSYNVSEESPVKFQVYSWSQAVNIKGDYVIRITNLSPTTQDANRDRVAIWNLNWTENK